jgi:N-acetylglucosamine-6-phosphate deacetylase
MRLGVQAALVRGELVRGDVEIDDGHIAAIGLAPVANGRIAVPGFVDLQVNGFGGVDFLTAGREDYARAGEALLATGVTAYQPTFITADEVATVEALREVPVDAQSPRVLGVHLEGPFISAKRLGAHPAAYRRDPDPALLDRLLDAGPVTEMTVAPELPGAVEMMARLRERGIVVSLGHTEATADEARRAFNLGATGVTHVFNAMRPLQSREPGIIGAALTRADVILTMIVDGQHLADETVRLVWSSARGRVALITDAIAAAGAGEGEFMLGDTQVSVVGGAPPMREDGTLAGTVLTMIDAVRNLHLLGVPLDQAVRAASSVPARLLGRTDVGVLAPGAPADVVVLDDRVEIVAVVSRGDAAVVAGG